MDPSFCLLGFLLIGAGFLLLVAELFLCTGGVLWVLSASSIVVGLGILFIYDASIGVFTLLGVFAALPVIGSLLFHYWPRSAIGRRILLTRPAGDDTVASLPVNQELENLKGRYGRTLSALRPAGMVDFDGRRIDTITEGMMVDPDQWVRCIDVRAGKVIVRPAEKPNLDDLENAVFN
jgi:membrane-bound serine protease (ClpP class)